MSYSSFTILDEPITPLPLVIDLLPILLKYKEEYELADTPRNFINILRNKYKDKYCNEVGKWLNQYMLYLNIKIFMDNWYILDKYINKPPNFKAQQLTDVNIKYKLNGGTRKNHSKYGIISNNILHKSFIGTYTEYK